MAEIAIIYGKSGAGKTTSLKGFADAGDDIVLIQATQKRLPFKGKFRRTAVCASADAIINILQKSEAKVAVIDDAFYIMSNQFFNGHGAGDQFKLYNSIADNFMRLINCVENLPEDEIVYIMMHEETDDAGNVKYRTIGKLLDSKANIEGKVNISLRAVTRGGEHLFLTNTTTGSDITKSPFGMFEAEEPNDLKKIDAKIRDFWEIPG